MLKPRPKPKARKPPAVTHDVASFTVHFLPAEEGGHTVEVPALEGCVTEGDTFEEAERNAREAIGLYVAAHLGVVAATATRR
jgi:predicted RNase H-like HicB family nuclease